MIRNFVSVLTGLMLVCGAILVATAGHLHADIVLPDSSFATTEGNSNAATPFGLLDSQSQWLYEDSLFSGGPISINGLRVRRDALIGGGPGTFSSSNFRIDLSSTSKTGATLEATFDNNHGSNRTTVLNGALSFSYSDGGSPNAFGDLIVFDTPFVYDPNSGDSLLFHFFQFDTSVTGLFAADRETGSSVAPTGFAWNNDPNASTASFLTAEDALIMQLDVSIIPEPGSIMLLGVLSTVGLIRRRREKLGRLSMLGLFDVD